MTSRPNCTVDAECGAIEEVVALAFRDTDIRYEDALGALLAAAGSAILAFGASQIRQRV